MENIVDNFELIEGLLNFTNDGDFYMLQIMKRGKDQNDGSNSSYVRVIKSYYIKSVEYLEERKEEIIDLCEFFNARACINLNKKNYKQVAMKSLELCASAIAHEEYHAMRTLFESACGKSGACDKDKTWIVDVDTKEVSEIEKIVGCLDQCEPFDCEKVVAIIPTVNGYHIITKPFNKNKFRKIYTENIDIHDNNPTVLYYKKK